MAKDIRAIDPVEVWSVTYRLLMLVITEVQPDVAALGLEMKELLVLAEVDAHPYPADLASTLCMPKPTVTVNVKRLEASGFVRREIDPSDLRRHKLLVTAAGRKALNQGLALLSKAFGERLGRLSAAKQAELRTLLTQMIHA